LNGGRPEDPWRSNPVINRAPPKGSIGRVHDKHLILSNNVVGYNKGVSVGKYMPMEIMKDKKSGKKGR
jgi:hypothetical protein